MQAACHLVASRADALDILTLQEVTSAILPPVQYKCICRKEDKGEFVPSGITSLHEQKQLGTVFHLRQDDSN